MPFYEIQHHYPLGPTQRQRLAKALTDLHARTFTTPATFVNVRFRLMDFGEENFFVGGEPRFKTNQIFVHVRSGSSRGRETFEKLAKDIENIWDDVVGGGYRKMYRLEAREGEDKLPPDDRKEHDRIKEENPKLLQGVFIIPGLIAREQGLAHPAAGEELPWLKNNWSLFNERSLAGDSDMTALIKDVNARKELGGKGQTAEDENPTESKEKPAEKTAVANHPAQKQEGPTES